MSEEPLKHLNKIQNVNSNKGIKFSHKAVTPGSHCPMHTTLANIRRFGSISTLVVGMPECGYYSRYVMNSPIGPNGELHYTYQMDSNEVVFGCREGVKNAIKQMEAEGAKTIAIIVTCIPELIGEDIEAVINELSGEVSVKLLCYNVAHFKRNGYQAGFFNTIAKLINTVEDEVKNRNKLSVNILGTCESKELNNFKSILEKAGYELKFIDFNSSLEAIKKTVASRLSIVVSPKMDKLAQELKEKYNIPYISFHSVYSSRDIKDRYEKIFELLNIEENSYFQDLFDEMVELENKCKHKLLGKKFISTDSELDSIPLALYLANLEMEPMILHVEEFYEENKIFIERMKEQAINPKVCYITNTEEIAKDMKEFDIDLCLGNIQGFSEIGQVKSFELNKIFQSFGYERTSKLLEKILNTIEERS